MRPELMPPEAACLAAPYVQRSLDRSNPDGNTLEEVLGAIADGEAHLLAWRHHGEKIREHGPEWRRFCNELVEERRREYCRR